MLRSPRSPDSDPALCSVVSPDFLFGVYLGYETILE